MPVSRYLSTPELANAAGEALRWLEGTPRCSESKIRLARAGERSRKPIYLPPEVVAAIHEILAQLAGGNAVAVVPASAELTTQQAADFLNVSRPFFVKLLLQGAVPFRLVGTHRRVNLSDVLRYQSKIEAERERTMREITAMEQDAGLYDLDQVGPPKFKVRLPR